MAEPRFEPRFSCKIKCDSCETIEEFSARSAEALDSLIDEHGWQRFSPGVDLCHKCKGGSPNTIIQVRKP
jgi:hypothetical protein